MLFRSTLTGSIGVIMETANFEGLLQKIGVEGVVVKSGKYKDVGSPLRKMSDEERSLLQVVMDDVHKQFIEAVAEGRALEVSDVQALADGRIFTGRQAKDAKLVDELGNFEVALDRALRLSGLEGAKLVSYQPHFRFPGFLSLLGQARSASVKVDLGLPLTSRLPEGRLYFMSPLHVR